MNVLPYDLTLIDYVLMFLYQTKLVVITFIMPYSDGNRHIESFESQFIELSYVEQEIWNASLNTISRCILMSLFSHCFNQKSRLYIYLLVENTNKNTKSWLESLK